MKIMKIWRADMRYIKSPKIVSDNSNGVAAICAIRIPNEGKRDFESFSFLRRCKLFLGKDWLILNKVMIESFD